MSGSDHDKSLMQAAADRVERLISPQAELLGLDLAPPSGERGKVLAQIGERRAKAGRPPGARNKRSEEVARFVLETFGDPLLHQAAIATMGILELAAFLGCTPFEAAQEKRLASVAVLPYLHKRQAVAIDLTNHKVVHLHIGDLGAMDASEDDQVTILGDVEVVQNQADNAVTNDEV